MAHRIAVGLAVLAAAVPALAGSIGGSTITVSTTTDELTLNGQCSLREAITNANNDNQSGSADCVAGSGADTIEVPAGSYDLAIAGTGDDQNASGDLDILADLVLSGAGMETTVIDGQNLDRVFHVKSGSATFRRLTVQGGSSSDGGTPSQVAAGILGTSSGVLVLDRTRVAYNTTTATGAFSFGAGGVLANDLTLRQSQIDHNTATFLRASGAFAGGVACDGTTCDISDTVISNNTALTTFTGTGPGPLMTGGLTFCSLHLTRSRIHANEATGSTSAAGGMRNSCGSTTITMSHTLVDGNSATVTADMSIVSGGLGNGGGDVTFHLSNMTFAGNIAHTGSVQRTVAAGGITSGASATWNLRQSTFSGNRTDGSAANTFAINGAGVYFTVANTLFDGDACSGAVTSLGGNLEGPDATCGLSQSNDQSAVADRGVEALADNGGGTLTLALKASSPAIDRGDDSQCEALDQRGVPRPFDGDGDGTATCDVGAYELFDRVFADGFE
ncbi:choice-of-anchor Q domain-containing protein [Tahibacter amnicola]|uniref:CSLREA domain-containing protein n=1 Tax=Tahibacter amnicola TaxID=2976241 RepID=A0ABY6BE43_9GAMM|nr:choice-of-anchor Q domain-containing protein [Tahibacter amnicola]UXI66177.1 CSLREA domain-containing protein [Tahibacter amnicola]